MKQSNNFTKLENKEVWDKKIAEFSQANFLQSYYWAETNRLAGNKIIAEDFSDGIWLGIIKDAKRGRYLEVAGGPLMDWNNSKLAKKVIARIKEVAKTEKCVFVRMRPQIRDSAEARKQFKDLGAKIAPMHLHAEHTVIVDLTKSEDELMGEFRRQTRYEVRRANKLGIKVSESNDDSAIKVFHKLQTETAARQHFVPPSLKYLLAMREAFLEKLTIYTAKDENDKVIAMGIIIRAGDEAEYFEAASTDLNRKLPGAYALQWFAMRELKKLGIKRYNLWGIAPAGQKNHRYAGVTTFKTGFGGEAINYLPAHDFIINKPRYLINWLIEVARKKWRKL